MDAARFEEIRNHIVGTKRVRSGIGTLQEKTVHAVLKDYYAPDKDTQEKRVSGYVADIYTGREIIEIQTSNFHALRDKLDVFLPDYPVTLVYPIPKIKYLIWMDEENKTCSKPRKSNAKGSVYRAFYELYKIKPYLSDENLHLCFPLLELEEYRLLNGWSHDRKRGSRRYDRVPLRLLGEVRIDGISDYGLLIPEGLKEPFTVQEFGKAIKEQQKIAARVVSILHYLHVIERCENRGRAYTYRTV